MAHRSAPEERSDELGDGRLIAARHRGRCDRRDRGCPRGTVDERHLAEVFARHENAALAEVVLADGEHAREDDVEVIALVSFAADRFAGLELAALHALREAGEGVGWEIREERNPGELVEGGRLLRHGRVDPMQARSELEGWRHCPRCAGALEAERRSVHCPACGLDVYANPHPAVCALVVDEAGRVLLARRAREPRAGLWDVLGGFMGEDEQPFDTMRRELLEETGLEVEPGEFVATVSDRYGEGGNATLNVCWTARIVGGEPYPADDVSELRWFAPDELPPAEEFAFRNSIELLEAWRSMRRIR